MMDKKNRAWEEIRTAFRARNPDMQPRSVPQLRRIYNRIKQSVKKEESEFKKKIRATGGGPPPPQKFSDEHEMIIEMLQPEIMMGDSTYDSFGQNSQTITSNIHDDMEEETVCGSTDTALRDSFAEVRQVPEVICLEIRSGDVSQPALQERPGASSSAVAAGLTIINSPSAADGTWAPPSSSSDPPAICSAAKNTSSPTTTSDFGEFDTPQRAGSQIIRKVPKARRGRFAEEYEWYKRKQDVYYELLIKNAKQDREQKKQVHEQKMQEHEQKKQEHEQKKQEHEQKKQEHEQKMRLYKALLVFCEESGNMIKKTCTQLMNLASERN